MNFKLRGTNVIALELLVNKENFNLENIQKFIAERKQILKGARLILCVEDYLLKPEEVKELIEFFKNEEDFVFCGFKTNLRENRELCLKLGIPCEISELD
jgi:septum site-determining protein MinC